MARNLSTSILTIMVAMGTLMITTTELFTPMIMPMIMITVMMGVIQVAMNMDMLSLIATTPGTPTATIRDIRMTIIIHIISTFLTGTATPTATIMPTTPMGRMIMMPHTPTAMHMNMDNPVSMSDDEEG